MKRPAWLPAIVLWLFIMPNPLAAQTPLAGHQLDISPFIDGDNADYGVAWKKFREDLQSNLNRQMPEAKITVRLSAKQRSASQQLAALASGTTPEVFALSCGNTATALLNPSWFHYRTSFVLCDAHHQPLMYRPLFIATRDQAFSSWLDGCRTLTQLAAELDSHKNLLFGLGDPNSLSSYRVPMLVMADGCHRWNTIRCGGQNDLINKVVSGQISAACVADDVLRLSGNWDKVRVIRIVGDGVNPLFTGAFPAISYGWRTDLPPQIQNCISNTFAHHNWGRDRAFRKIYTQIKGVPVGGIVKIDSAERLWNAVIQIQQLPLKLVQ